MSDYEKKLMEEADFFFNEENFLRALPLYVKLHQSFPGGDVYGYKAGICYLYKSDEHEKAVEFLEAVEKNDNEVEELYFYLGRAYHLTNRFDEAIEAFRKFFKEDLTPEEIKITNRYIEYCENGKILTQNPLSVDIINIGAPINTNAFEYVPVISSDESVLLFTYRGERSLGGLLDNQLKPSQNGDYFEDIFSSYKVGERWLNPVPVENLNTNGHDAAIGISPDGQKLILFKSTPRDGGDIFISELKGNIWGDAVKVGGEVNTKYWEGSASLSSNGRILYFSSDRPGGFGGRDIYKTELQSDSVWGKPVNMGATINTPFDDDAPFIHPDDKILHFSSKGHNSMGGYDIFVTYLNGKGGSTIPENVGYPINTTDDDTYYVLNADGSRGYYSSGMAGGAGMQDIYSVNPGLFGKKPVLVLLKGKVTTNGNPAEAKITVKFKGNERSEGNYKSNSSSGKYLINLPAGHDYNIAYEVKGFPIHMEYVDAMKVDSFLEKIIDVELNTVEYELAKKSELKQAETTKQVEAIQPATAIGDNKKVVKIPRIYFDFDESVLKNEYLPAVNELIDLMRSIKELKIEITGNTDNKGTEEYNQALSKQRSKIIADYFIAKGINKGRIEIKYNGEKKPINTNENPDGSDNPEGRAKNRRTEFKIVSAPGNIQIDYEDNPPLYTDRL